MQPLTNLTEHLGRIGDILAVVGPALAWGYRIVRRIENNLKFTKDVAHEHLPHIYDRLRRSDEALKLEVPDHPPIVFVNGVSTPRVGQASNL